jgi:hypothetical protein
VSALESGGWLNSGAQHGEYDRYQSSESIDVKSLESVLNECGSMEMTTAVGRAAELMGNNVLLLRQQLQFALKPSPPVSAQLWEAVSSCLSNVPRSDQFATHPSSLSHHWRLVQQEFAVASKEVDFQQQACRISNSLEKAISSCDQPSLEKLLARADRLNMQAKYYQTVCFPCSLVLSSFQFRWFSRSLLANPSSSVLSSCHKPR